MASSESNAGDVWTVRRILDWTTDHLRKQGSDTPRLDAEILLAHARGCPRIQLYVDYSEPLTDAERGVMRDLVRRRAQAEPVAYLVGKREFFGLDFRVTADVLIPRPETETLVLEVLTAARKRGGESAGDGEAARGDAAPYRILELGTGSGCIAVSCAVHLPQAQVTAVDISPKALALARENAVRHGKGEAIRFLEGDLFAALGADERFDAIVSNPPYVASGEMATLPADVRLHEPHLALEAGPQGLDVVQRIIAGAPTHLVPGGALLLEISPEQAPAVVRLLADAGGYEAARVVKDAGGLARVVATRWSVPAAQAASGPDVATGVAAG